MQPQGVAALVVIVVVGAAGLRAAAGAKARLRPALVRATPRQRRPD